MTKRNDKEAATQAALRRLQKALKPFPPVAAQSAATVFALTAALQARDSEDVAAWLDTLAKGVRDGTIAVSSEGWRIN